MTKHASFSAHAFDKATERLSLTQEEVATLLDSEKSIIIGTSGNYNKTFRMFWSKPDNDCFFAIQDQTSGVVITVQPLHYLRNFSLKESDVIRLIKINQDDSQHGSVANELPPTKYEFEVDFLNETTKRFRRCRIDIPTADYPDFVILFRALEYMESVVNKLISFVERNIQGKERLAIVYIRVGAKKERFWVPWNANYFRMKPPAAAGQAIPTEATSVLPDTSFPPFYEEMSRVFDLFEKSIMGNLGEDRAKVFRALLLEFRGKLQNVCDEEYFERIWDEEHPELEDEQSLEKDEENQEGGHGVEQQYERTLWRLNRQ